jgi:hypothetical protein
MFPNHARAGFAAHFSMLRSKSVAISIALKNKAAFTEYFAVFREFPSFGDRGFCLVLQRTAPGLAIRPPGA